MVAAKSGPPERVPSIDGLQDRIIAEIALQESLQDEERSYSTLRSLLERYHRKQSAETLDDICIKFDLSINEAFPGELGPSSVTSGPHWVVLEGEGGVQPRDPGPRRPGG